MDLSQVREKSKRIKEIVGLNTYPVGVRFSFAKNPVNEIQARKLHDYRYCQALMEARHGEHVLLDREGISCPAAAAAFGFKPLPEALKNGKALVGFGITKEKSTGQTMFENMPAFPPGELESLYLFPLETAAVEPDIVVIEDKIENLMWVALAYLNVQGGERIESSTAILQATCVDATIVPYKKNKINLSYGCYGCREATDIGPDEAVLGVPFNDFEKISEYVEYLARRAMPNSRAKNAFALLKKRSADKVGS